MPPSSPLSLQKALGTSSATIVITACAAGIGYVLRGWGIAPSPFIGYVDYLHAMPLILGSIPCAMLGAGRPQTDKAPDESLRIPRHHCILFFSRPVTPGVAYHSDDLLQVSFLLTKSGLSDSTISSFLRIS
jgi:hypothetical protein